jgi:hypothetical protein
MRRKKERGGRLSQYSLKISARGKCGADSITAALEKIGGADVLKLRAAIIRGILS